ncbi:MAG: hypothetical protein ABIL18_06820 [candidate division WOR-3 bacterium]
MLLLLILNFTLPGVSSQGDFVYYYDARSLGVGGNTTILENGLNPATIGLSEKIQINFSGFLYEGTEKRGLRVYDSYGNNIGISTVSVCQTSFLDLGPASVIVPIKFFSLGVKHYRMYDFRYYFNQTYRDNFYQIVKIVDNKYTGAVNALAPMVGVSYKGVSMGFESDFIYGAINNELKTIYPAAEDSIKRDSKNLSGTGFKFGIMYAPSLYIRIAYFLENKFKVFAESDTFEYPMGHNIGFYYQPPYRIPTKFAMEINYKMWDEAIYFYKFGVEHTVLYNYAVRYGFCLYPDYNQNAIWTTNLTLGLGGQFKNYCFDVGFSLGKRDYANTDFGGLGIEEKYIFDETNIHYILSFGFKL